LLDDGVLAGLDRERLARVLRPKASGSWLLHSLTAGHGLDWFVLFSSAAAVLGSPGQANYAAANAFLDALAHERRRLGLPAISVNWGPWAEVGMAARDPQRGPRMVAQGLGAIPPSEGLELLGRLLTTDTAQLVVLPLEWGRLPPRLRQMPLLADLAVRSAATEPDPSPTEAPIRERLEAAEPGQRQPLLIEYLQREAARSLQLPPGRVDPGEPIARLGLDSLMALELRNRLEASLGIALAPARLLQSPTLASLAQELLEQWVPGAGREPPAADALLAHIDQLSEGQVDALLSSMLTQEVERA
jgi:acyl carrier protein